MRFADPDPTNTPSNRTVGNNVKSIRLDSNNWEAPASSWCRVIKNISILSCQDQSMSFSAGQNRSFSRARKKLIKEAFPVSKAELLPSYLPIFLKTFIFFLNVLLKILIHYQAWFSTRKYIFWPTCTSETFFQSHFCKRHHGKCNKKGENRSILDPIEQLLSNFQKTHENLFLEGYLASLKNITYKESSQWQSI